MRIIDYLTNRKIVPVISLLFMMTVFLISTEKSWAATAKAPPKLFLYSSTLPIALTNQYYILRKHVVDVLLATQIYDIVFSEIPNTIVKSSTSQYILKYKLRTDGQSTYRIEYYLINADEVQVSRRKVLHKVQKENLLFEFRLSLYEFVLDKKLRTNQLKEFKQHSEKRISKIYSKELEVRTPRKVKNLKEILSPKLEKVQSLDKKMKGSISSTDSKSPKVEKASLWELLKDQDTDVAWTAPPIKAVDKKKSEKKKIKMGKITAKIQKTLNPFLFWANLSLKSANELKTSLGANQLHVGWKYVQRDIDVDDLVTIKNEFTSVLGLTLEWVYYLPLHVSRLVLRTGMEIDQTFKTTPIDMDNHFLFRAGAGYRVNNWFMPSLYFEQSNLNYANLNTIGGGIKANTHTIKWLSLELAILGNQTYLSAHFAKSIASTKNGDTRESSPPTGFRYGANARYFFNNKYFGMRPWFDLEYRREEFKRKSIDSSNLSILKNEYSTRIGIYF
jgi:hypothetical protein